MKAFVGDYVRIVWCDSGTWHENGWETVEQILANSEGLVEVVTVGTLVHAEDDKYYVALSSDNKNNHYYGIQIIWKQAVVRMSVLVTARDCFE